MRSRIDTVNLERTKIAIECDCKMHREIDAINEKRLGVLIKLEVVDDKEPRECDFMDSVVLCCAVLLSEKRVGGNGRLRD